MYHFIITNTICQGEIRSSWWKWANMILLQTDILSIHFKRLCTYFRSWLFYYLWHTRILLQPLKNSLCVSIKTIRLLWIEPFMINMIGLTNAIVINPFGQVECSRIFDIWLFKLTSSRVMSFIYAWRRSRGRNGTHCEQVTSKLTQ